MPAQVRRLEYLAHYVISVHRYTKKEKEGEKWTDSPRYKAREAVRKWARENDIYTVNGEYYKTAQTMTANADTPLIPERFHMAIVWRALMLYGAWAAANEKYAHGQNEFQKLMFQLEYDQREDMTFGEPLA